MAASCAAVRPARPVTILLLMASAPVMVSPAFATFWLFLGVLVDLVCTVGEVTRPDYRMNIILCGGILRGRGDSQARDPIVAYGKGADHGVACLGNLHAVMGVDIGLFRLNTRTAALHIRPVDAHLISITTYIGRLCLSILCPVSSRTDTFNSSTVPHLRHLNSEWGTTTVSVSQNEWHPKPTNPRSVLGAPSRTLWVVLSCSKLTWSAFVGANHQATSSSRDQLGLTDPPYIVLSAHLALSV